ncbi:unnamed protein product [Medioppia subpectinata]|uniref:60S ribosomal protein L32 n=1 Tax=Medioppia subpectinata TaxID=1979941 RepID=A0A7R9KHD8_9ACAR|nr:unnamed protein product [Medioppia subpectinata]CAG2102376.1 unnamed protein product [Medioppia subpectinata]
MGFQDYCLRCSENLQAFNILLICMASPTPLLTLKKEFKKKPAFKRYHSDRYMRVKESWRKPRGLDSRCRKKYNGTPVMPNKRFIKPALFKQTVLCYSCPFCRCKDKSSINKRGSSSGNSCDQ